MGVGRLGIPERLNFYIPSESAKGWTTCAPNLAMASSKRLEVPGRGSIIFAASVGGVVVSASAVGVG